MKRLLTILAAVLIVLSSLPLVSAVETQPAFTVTDITAKRGETVEAEIRITDNPGITALQLNIDYSASDLELLAIDSGGAFDDPVTYGALDSDPVTLSWYASDSRDKTSDGTVATLRFRIRENARTSSIKLSATPDNIFNIAFDNIHFDMTDGTVIVEEPKTVRGDADGDGKITVIDATCIQRSLAGIPGSNEPDNRASDVDGDGRMTVVDATCIQRFLAALPDPYGVGASIYTKL